MCVARKVLDDHRAQVATPGEVEMVGTMLKTKEKLNYDDFLRHATSPTIPRTLRRFFTAEHYLMFPKDHHGGILTASFVKYVQRSVDVEAVSLQLLAHAKETAGYINERELERFLYERIPEIGACAALPESFYPYWCFTAARFILFFIDARRTRRLPIKKLAHSVVINELLLLKRSSSYSTEADADADAIDPDASWFSGANALKVFASFVDLDSDQNGILCEEELLAFAGPTAAVAVQLTRTAVRRIFEENITYEPQEMDYKTFLDLYLALQHKTTVEALSYFWRLLDIEKCGRLTPTAIRHFYSDVYDTLRASGYDAPSVDNVIVEINDIVACSSGAPTFQDLVASGQGHVVVSMLLDSNGFWAYDNRESLMHQQSNDNE